MPTATLCRIILWVREPVALSAWYQRAFGWTIAVDERADGWIELDTGGGMRVALHAGRKAPAHHWPKLQVRVENIEQARAAFITQGIALDGIQNWKEMAWCEGADPEGNVFQLVNR